MKCECDICGEATEISIECEHCGGVFCSGSCERQHGCEPEPETQGNTLTPTEREEKYRAWVLSGIPDVWRMVFDEIKAHGLADASGFPSRETKEAFERMVFACNPKKGDLIAILRKRVAAKCQAMRIAIEKGRTLTLSPDPTEKRSWKDWPDRD